MRHQNDPVRKMRMLDFIYIRKVYMNVWWVHRENMIQIYMYTYLHEKTDTHLAFVQQIILFV